MRSIGPSVSNTVTAGGVPVLQADMKDACVYGNVYTTGGPPSGSHQTGTSYPVSRSPSLREAAKFVTKSPPTYADYSLSDVVNVKTVSGLPVYGDGTTDDTRNLNAIISVC